VIAHTLCHCHTVASRFHNVSNSYYEAYSDENVELRVVSLIHRSQHHTRRGHMGTTSGDALMTHPTQRHRQKCWNQPWWKMSRDWLEAHLTNLGNLGIWLACVPSTVSRQSVSDHLHRMLFLWCFSGCNSHTIGLSCIAGAEAVSPRFTENLQAPRSLLCSKQLHHIHSFAFEWPHAYCGSCVKKSMSFYGF
jgi:hypothetical protein